MTNAAIKAFINIESNMTIWEYTTVPLDITGARFVIPSDSSVASVIEEYIESHPIDIIKQIAAMGLIFYYSRLFVIKKLKDECEKKDRQLIGYKGMEDTLRLIFEGRGSQHDQY